VTSKYKLKLKDFKLQYIKDYIFPAFNIFRPKKKIKNIEDLKKFIQRKSAWVTQETLYGYLKTRMGTKYVLMFDDEIFLGSINKAKWNIYSKSIQDLTLYCLSYIKDKINLDYTGQAQNIYEEILLEEKKNEMPEDVIEKGKENFLKRLESSNWVIGKTSDNFKESSHALYDWAPIADELKVLDKKIVINSMCLKWENIEKEFSELINF